MAPLVEVSDNNEKVYRMDPVLDLPVHGQKKAQQHVYGLPALQHESLYMIDIPPEPEWSDEGDFESYTLECTWGVAFL